MKHLITGFLAGIFIMLIVGFSTLPNNDENSLAKVQKNQDLYVFVFAEPVQPYDVVFEYGTVIWTINSVENYIDVAVKQAKKKADKQKTRIDGIIISKGKDIAIRFKS